MTANLSEADASKPVVTIHLSPALELTDEQFFEGDPELPGFTLDLQEIWNPNI